MQIFILDIRFVNCEYSTVLMVTAESYEQAILEIHALILYEDSIETITVLFSTFINSQATVYRLNDKNEDKFKYSITPFSNYELD